MICLQEEMQEALTDIQQHLNLLLLITPEF